MYSYIYEAPVSVTFKKGELDRYKSCCEVTDQENTQTLHLNVKVGLDERSDKKAYEKIKAQIQREYPGRKFIIYDSNGFWHGRR